MKATFIQRRPEESADQAVVVTRNLDFGTILVSPYPILAVGWFMLVSWRMAPRNSNGNLAVSVPSPFNDQNRKL
jgi:hypothetical protein